MKKTPSQFAVDSQEILNLFDQEYSDFDFSNADEINKYEEHQINYHWWEYYEWELVDIFNEFIVEPLKNIPAKVKEEAFSNININLSPAKNLLNSKTEIVKEATELKDKLSEKEKYEIAAIPLVLGMLVNKNREAMSLYGSGFSMHELLTDATKNNNEDALLMAINIDSTCLKTKTALSFVSKTHHSVNDENFLANISLAINKQYRSPNISYNTEKYREFSFYESLLRNYADETEKKLTIQEIAEISINKLELFHADINDDLIIKKISELRKKGKSQGSEN